MSFHFCTQNSSPNVTKSHRPRQAEEMRVTPTASCNVDVSVSNTDEVGHIGCH